jgi:hypothetical protein
MRAIPRARIRGHLAGTLRPCERPHVTASHRSFSVAETRDNDINDLC